MLLATSPSETLAWPTDSDWHHLTAFNSTTAQPTSDITSDGQGSRDIVGDSTYPAAYTFNDGAYIYYRIRLNDDPRDNSGTALWPFGWGFLVDTDGNLGDYEYMVMLDGINNPDAIYLAQNTQKTNLSDPSDHAETVVWQETLDNNPISGNYQVVLADSTFATNQTNPDYFLDYRMPYNIFKASLGLQDDSLIRYFVGSSNNAQALTADLTAGSVPNSTATIIDGVSDFILPSGKKPSDGSIQFVTDISGSTSLTEFYPNETIYIQVVDDDQNGIASEIETLSATITSPSGDSEVVVLTETGTDTGIFITSISTSTGAITTNDGTIQVSPIEFITAAYTDAADAALDQNIFRTTLAKALPTADVGLTKSVDNPTPNESNEVVFTITATNQGPSSAAGIQVTDQMPSGLTYVSDDGSGSYNPATGVWVVSTLSPLTNAALNITATVDSGTTLTEITNIASITAAAQTDPNTINDIANTSIAVTGADLSISKAVSEATPSTGSDVTFVITVTNNGFYDATNVVINDLLPPGELVYVADDSGGSYDFSTGNWAIGTLTNGETVQLQITATVAAANGTIIINTATISGSDQNDPDSSNDSSSSTLYVGGADLELLKTVDIAVPNEGDSIVFTLTLTNHGTNTQNGILVEDILPRGLTFVSATGTGNYDPATGIWDIGSLSALAGSNQATMQLTASVDTNTASQRITNNASITSPAATNDPDGSNNFSSVDIDVSYLDLAITKTVNNSTPQDGEAIAFTLTVTNNGPLDATSVQVYDALPTQLSYTSSNSPQGGSYSPTTNIWTVGSLASGSSAELTINSTVSLSNQVPTTFFNLASIHQVDQGDPIAGNDTSSVFLGVQGTDISITKNVTPSAPSSGGQVTYTVTVTNNGPNDATNLIISENLPAGLSYVASTDDYDPSPTQDNTSYDSGKGEWKLGYKSGGSSIFPRDTTATLTIVADVTAANGTEITNTALLKSMIEADTNPANNSAQATISVGGTDLALNMIVDNTTPTVGDTVSFTITLSNFGPFATSGIEINELLPAGFIYASHTAEAGSLYDQATGLWDLSALTLGVNGTATLVLDATIDSGTGGMTLTNTASVNDSGSLDPNATNDSASADVVVQESDLAITISVDNATPSTGSNIIFTITIINNGPHETTGIEVSALLPSGLTFVSPAIPESGTSYNDSTGVWDLTTISLAKTSTATLTLTASADNDQGGNTITDTVNITALSVNDPNLANNRASIGVSPRSPATLTIVKMANVMTAQPGDTITYTLIVTNTGQGAAANIVLDDDMSPFTDLELDPFGTGDFYSFNDPSGRLVPGAPTFTTDASGDITAWQIPMSGTMLSNGNFTFIYQATVE